MSWAEVQNLKDTLTDSSNSKIYIKTDASYANKKILVKRYDRDYMEVTLDSLGEAEVEVAPRSKYEVYIEDDENPKTSGAFYIGSGDYITQDFGSSESTYGSSGLLRQTVTEITQAEYNALGDKVLTDNIAYYIKDAEGSDRGSLIHFHITYDGSTLAGATIKAQCGDEIYTTVADNSGESVINTKTLGEWTISEDKYNSSSTVTTTYYGNYYTKLSSFDYETLLSKGGFTDAEILSYSSLSDILNNEETIRRLFTVHASVDYLASVSNTYILTTIFNNNLCAKWINLRDYALDTLYASSTCKDIMDSVGKYFYGEWTLVNQIPVMLSNTAPYGVASASSVNSDSSQQPYFAFSEFRNSLNSGWYCAKDTYASAYLQYEFPVATSIDAINLQGTTRGTSDTSTVTYDITCDLLASNDGSSWVTIATNVEIPCASNKITKINSTKSYLFYRLSNFSSYNFYYRTSEKYVGIHLFELLAWGPKGNIPIMTSDSAPYGVASASSTYSKYSPYYILMRDGCVTNYHLWHPVSGSEVEDTWYSYKFANPIDVKRLDFTYFANKTSGAAVIQASNDGSTWVDVSSSISINQTSDLSQAITDSSLVKMSVNVYTKGKFYTMYRLILKSLTSSVSYDGAWVVFGLASFQCYGRELKVSVPKMTSNTMPFGIVNSSDAQSGYPAYYAFNQVEPTYTDGANSWYSSKNTNAWISYKFAKSSCIRYVKFRARTVDGRGLTVKTYTIQASNDNSVWETLYSGVYSASGANYEIQLLDNSKSYYYYRIYVSDTDNLAVCIQNIYMFGTDYSEREFAEDSNMRYIYDHGVGVNNLSNVMSINSYGYLSEHSVCGVVVSSTDVSNSIADYYNIDSIDSSKYSMIGVVAGDLLEPNSSSNIVNIVVWNGTIPSTTWGNRLSYATLNFTSGVYSKYIFFSDISDTTNTDTYISIGSEWGTSSTSSKYSFDEMWIE